MHLVALLINASVHSAGTSHLQITLGSSSCSHLLPPPSLAAPLSRIYLRGGGEANELDFIVPISFECALHCKSGTWPHPPILSFNSEWVKLRNGRVSLTVSGWLLCVSGHSLVEEGEQVTHHHERRPRDAQQDLTDALRSLVEVFYPCSKTHLSVSATP